MNVIIKRSATKEILKLPTSSQAAAVTKIAELETTAMPRGYRKLKGYRDLYRVRIGDYRMIYSFDGKERINILRVRHRSRVYDGL